MGALVIHQTVEFYCVLDQVSRIGDEEAIIVSALLKITLQGRDRSAMNMEETKILMTD